MGMFVEEMTFSQLRTGDYIEFSNHISGNNEAGTVVSTSVNYIQVEQWDKDMGGNVCNTYGKNDISNITKIK